MKTEVQQAGNLRSIPFEKESKKGLTVRIIAATSEKGTMSPSSERIIKETTVKYRKALEVLV